MSELLIKDRYRLIHTIGSGGMGKVWKAEDLRKERVVAIKQVYLGSSEEAQTDIRRFDREALLLRELDHPNIIQVFAFFQEGKRRYLVMEYMEAGSLYDRLERQGPITVARAREIGLAVCDALAHAHRLGAIHRDIKPENILLRADGTPVLTDFGLALLKGGTALTKTGFIVGSLSHISPEVCQGQRASERSDVWGLGVTLYEAVAGKAPFQRSTVQNTVMAILRETPPPIHQLCPEVPPTLSELIAQMLQKDPSKRPHSVQAVAKILQSIVT